MVQTSEKSKAEHRSGQPAQECAAGSKTILRAVDAMSGETRAVFLMHCMDDMDIDEISAATRVSSRKARALLRNGRRKMRKAFEKELGRRVRRDEIEGDEIVFARNPVVKRALEQGLENLMGEGSLARTMIACMSAADAADADGIRGREDRIARRVLASRDSFKRIWQDAIPERTSGKEGGIFSFFRGTGAGLRASGSTAAALWTLIKTSSIMQAVTVLSVGVLAVGGFALANDAENRSIGLLRPSPSEETEEPVRIAEEPVMVEETPVADDTTVDLPPASIIPPQEYPAQQDDAGDRANDARLAAFRNGEIHLTGSDCTCGHVNPRGAEIPRMEDEEGKTEWVIARDDATPLYSGVGTAVSAELRSLYSEYGDGLYRIVFFYTTADGLRAEKSRPIFIDTGVITENQYE